MTLLRRSTRVLVCDGAMGTMLYARGRVHQQELRRAEPDAGADSSRPCTRSTCAPAPTSSRPTPSAPTASSSASFGLADRCTTINVDGAQIARRAAGDRAYVAGVDRAARHPHRAVGQDRGRRGPRVLPRAGAALLDGGVDLFILETFRDLNEIGAAIDAVRSLSDLPIIAQMTTEEDGNTLDGTPPERFAPELETARRDDPRRQLRGRTRRRCSRRSSGWRRSRRLRLSAQPNAGKPRDVEGRNIYLCSPEYMASYARRFVLHNVRVVGGCCGTTPEHIRQIKAAVRGARRRRAGDASARRVAAEPAGGHRGAAGAARAEVAAGPASWRAAPSSSASNCCRRAASRPSRPSSAPAS